jgi:hypothetical protein
MTIKGILMAGAALCTVCAAPAFAKSAPKIAVVALHQGSRTVIKTPMHSTGDSKITSSGTIYTYVSAADYKVKTPLVETYYTYLSNSSICNAGNGKTYVKLSTKKTKYAKLSTGTETYSEGCGYPTVFYGDIYDLTTKKPKDDTFVSSLIGKKIHYDGGKYNITVNFTIEVLPE